MPYSYGWKMSRPDWRDRHLMIGPQTIATLPPAVDLRPQCPPVLDQMSIGSCTANAIASALQYDQMKQQLPSYTPSRLYIYWNERNIENSTNYDSGAEIRDGFKSLRNVGYCPESVWGYDIAKFTQRPPLACYKAAKPLCGVAYARVMQTSAQVRGCLASGLPLVFGFTVYESFESQQVAQTGIMPMPAATEGVVGGHCVMCCGYQDDKQVFICQNSWNGWGDKGYFYMPYAYMLDPTLASDHWTIQHVLG